MEAKGAGLIICCPESGVTLPRLVVVVTSTSIPVLTGSDSIYHRVLVHASLLENLRLQIA